VCCSMLQGRFHRQLFGLDPRRRLYIYHKARQCCSVLQCITVYYSVLQCVAVCCSVLQCITVCCSVLQGVADDGATTESQSVLQVRCSVLQCVTVFCSVLQCVAVCRSVSQCITVCRSVLHCVAVCCSALQCLQHIAVCPPDFWKTVKWNNLYD